MGLSSSQARMLMLFARKSDLEQRGQNINNRRMLLANQTAEASSVYSNKLNNMTFKTAKVNNPDEMANLDGAAFAAKFLTADSGYTFKNANGEDVTADKMKELTKGQDALSLYTLLKNYTIADTKGNNLDMSDGLYTEDDAAASAKYKQITDRLQAQDKQLEIELKNIDTQHQAVQTEIDAVKKVIDKNIEMTFKTFG